MASGWRRNSVQQAKGYHIDLEITVGPSHLASHQGNSVLISEHDGQISWPSDKGLYFFDTRLTR
jgi:hypothetical protein